MSLAGHGWQERESRLPALAAAAVLHVALFAAIALFGAPKILPGGNAVPINIVTSAPTTDSRPAEQADQVQTAQTETPVPEAPPSPAPPPPPKAATPPKPTPTPVVPKPSPTPAKQPVKPAPPTPARQSFDWNSLQQTIAKAARTAPPRPSSAPRGPTRAETDLNARVDAGQGVSQSELEGLQQLLGRLWNPNCSAEGGADVKLKVSYWVGTDGRVRGAVSAGGAENSSDPVVYAAAHRAISAVHQVEPYAAQFQGQKITVNFNAKDVCANR